MLIALLIHLSHHLLFTVKTFKVHLFHTLPTMNTHIFLPDLGAFEINFGHLKKSSFIRSKYEFSAYLRRITAELWEIEGRSLFYSAISNKEILSQVLMITYALFTTYAKK